MITKRGSLKIKESDTSKRDIIIERTNIRSVSFRKSLTFQKSFGMTENFGIRESSSGSSLRRLRGKRLTTRTPH